MDPEQLEAYLALKAQEEERGSIWGDLSSIPGGLADLVNYIGGDDYWGMGERTGEAGRASLEGLVDTLQDPIGYFEEHPGFALMDVLGFALPAAGFAARHADDLGGVGRRLLAEERGGFDPGDTPRPHIGPEDFQDPEFRQEYLNEVIKQLQRKHGITDPTGELSPQAKLFRQLLRGSFLDETGESFSPPVVPEQVTARIAAQDANLTNVRNLMKADNPRKAARSYGPIVDNPPDPTVRVSRRNPAELQREYPIRSPRRPSEDYVRHADELGNRNRGMGPAPREGGYPSQDPDLNYSRMMREDAEDIVPDPAREFGRIPADERTDLFEDLLTPPSRRSPDVEEFQAPPINPRRMTSRGQVALSWDDDPARYLWHYGDEDAFESIRARGLDPEFAGRHGDLAAGVHFSPDPNMYGGVGDFTDPKFVYRVLREKIDDPIQRATDDLYTTSRVLPEDIEVYEGPGQFRPLAPRGPDNRTTLEKLADDIQESGRTLDPDFETKPKPSPSPPRKRKTPRRERY